MPADALGRPARFLLTGGQVHDSKAADGMTAVIPFNRSRKTLILHHAHLY